MEMKYLIYTAKYDTKLPCKGVREKHKFIGEDNISVQKYSPA